MRSFLTGIISTFLVAAALAVAFWWSGGVAAVQRQVSVVASAATSSIAPLTITEVAALPQSESPSASQAETYQGDQRIPILMYHYIRPMPDTSDAVGQGLTVTPEVFAEQMLDLKKLGYETVTFSDILRRQLPAHPVVVTFDDGYEDQYAKALPILLANNFKAIFYVVSNFVGRDGYLTWEQISDLSKRGMVVANHTVSHQNLADAALSGDALRRQIFDATAAIVSRINIVPYDFCYPSGKFDDRAMAAVREAGYRTATTTKSGWLEKGNSWWQIPRLRITNDTSLADLLSG